MYSLQRPKNINYKIANRTYDVINQDDKIPDKKDDYKKRIQIRNTLLKTPKIDLNYFNYIKTPIKTDSDNLENKINYPEEENNHNRIQTDYLNENDQPIRSKLNMYSNNAKTIKNKFNIVGKKKYNITFTEPNEKKKINEEEDDINSNLNINSERNKNDEVKELKSNNYLKSIQYCPSAKAEKMKPKIFINTRIENRSSKVENNDFLPYKKENDPIKKTNVENLYHENKNESNINNNLFSKIFIRKSFKDEKEKQDENIIPSSENNRNIPKFNNARNNIKDEISEQKTENTEENQERLLRRQMSMVQLNPENPKISNHNCLYIKASKKVKDEMNEAFSEIFDELNIFNSVLLLLSNISFTTQEMDKLNRINSKFEKNSKRYGLSFILYQLNRHLLNYPHTYKLTKNELKFNYEMYIKYLFTKSNDDDTLEEYLKNTKNAQFIIEYIFKKINKDLYNQPNLNLNNNNYNLLEFLKGYTKKYSSFISDHFIGFNIKQQFQFNYQYLNYDFYFDFVFDLNQMLINNENNNNLKTINLTYCFENYNNQINNNIISKTFSLPNVVTIILKPYDFTHIDFQYPDELSLNKILFSDFKLNDDGIYFLVGMLCKTSNNDKFICFYINQNNGIWYYRKDNNLVQQARKYNMNTMPIILFYQKANSLKFIYKNLERKEKSFYIFYSYQNGCKGRLHVPKKYNVSEISYLLSSGNSKRKIKAVLMGGNKLDLGKTFEENGVKEGDNVVIYEESKE